MLIRIIAKGFSYEVSERSGRSSASKQMPVVVENLFDLSVCPQKNPKIIGPIGKLWIWRDCTAVVTEAVVPRGAKFAWHFA